jgi:ketosteroid isomerase-like protein
VAVSRENIEAVRSVWEAYARKDVGAMQALCHPDVVIAQPPEMPDSKSYDGYSGVAESIDDWPAQWDDFRLDVTEIVEASDSSVVAKTHQQGRGHVSGLELDFEVTFLHTIRDGKFTRVDMFFDYDEALAAGRVGE